MALIALVAGLLFWSVAPTALGWRSNVVVSGSMAPGIRAGDVVLTQPVGKQRLRPGFVVLFADPGGADQTVLHRVVAVRPDGRLVTRGDANATADTTPLAADDVIGFARLRVPYVGLPVLWQQTEQYLRLLLTLGLLVLVLVAAGSGAGPSTAPRSTTRTP